MLLVEVALDGGQFGAKDKFHGLVQCEAKAPLEVILCNGLEPC